MTNAPANSSGGLLGSITGFFSPKKNNTVASTPAAAPAPATGGRRKKHRKTRKHRKHAKKSRKNRK